MLDLVLRADRVVLLADLPCRRDRGVLLAGLGPVAGFGGPVGFLAGWAFGALVAGFETRMWTGPFRG